MKRGLKTNWNKERQVCLILGIRTVGYGCQLCVRRAEKQEDRKAHRVAGAGGGQHQVASSSCSLSFPWSLDQTGSVSIQTFTLGCSQGSSRKEQQQPRSDMTYHSYCSHQVEHSPHTHARHLFIKGKPFLPFSLFPSALAQRLPSASPP